MTRSILVRIAIPLIIIVLVMQFVAMSAFVRHWSSSRTQPHERELLLPDRVFAIADLLEQADDPDVLLRALNGPQLVVRLDDTPVSDLVKGFDRLAIAENWFSHLQPDTQDREFAVFVAIPAGTDKATLSGIDAQSIWTSYPMRVAVRLKTGGTLVLETRGDLINKVYSLPYGVFNGMLGAICVVIAIGLLFRETAPLRALDKAARAFGATGKATHVELRGAKDVRSLIGSFNAMQARIGNLLETRTVMLGAIGHDMRTHLTRLRLKADQRETDLFADDIDRIAGIMDNCLTLAKPAPDALELPSLEVWDALALFDWDKVEGIGPNDDLQLFCNRVEFDRIVTNLFQNARRCADQVWVHVSVNAPHTVIKIMDNGPGISGADMERVLQPFEQGAAAATRNSAGSGLGLSIVNVLTLRNHGSFAVKNLDIGGLEAELRFLTAPSS